MDEEEYLTLEERLKSRYMTLTGHNVSGELIKKYLLAAPSYEQLWLMYEKVNAMWRYYENIGGRLSDGYEA